MSEIDWSASSQGSWRAILRLSTWKLPQLQERRGSVRVQDFPLGATVDHVRWWARERRWYRLGRPIPTPHSVKVRTIRAYARRFGIDTFVETGTYLGDTVQAMRKSFSQIYTVELDPQLYRRASKRFSGIPHVHMLHGDSAAVLGDLLPRLEGSCLFWLDGHYSGKGTARGQDDSPLRSELAHILARGNANDVVLIDDARELKGTGGYPTLTSLTEYLCGECPSWRIWVHNDMVHVIPRPTGRSRHSDV